MAARQDQALRRVIIATLAQLRAVLPAAPGPASGVTGLDRERAGRVMFLLTDALQTLRAPTSSRPESLSLHLEHRLRAEPMIHELTMAVIGSDSVEVLAPQARRLFADLEVELGVPQPPAAVETLFGTAKTVDYLRAVLVESVTLALRDQVECADQGVVEATRALSSVLAERHPGSTVEVRVPPASAVQVGALGQGSTHTRGTPPNVVETDPRTFVALAVGLTSWEQAVAQHRVQRSGAHADVVGVLLPLMALR